MGPFRQDQLLTLIYAKGHRSCASPDYITSQQNYAQQRDWTSIWIYTRNTSSTDKSYYYINSWIYIYLTTMNNASLSSNTKTRLSSSGTHAQLLDCSCHHWRPPPVKAVITHGNSWYNRSKLFCVQYLPTEPNQYPKHTIPYVRSLHILITCEQKKIYMYTDFFYSLLLRVFYKQFVENHQLKNYRLIWINQYSNSNLQHIFIFIFIRHIIVLIIVFKYVLICMAFHV